MSGYLKFCEISSTYTVLLYKVETDVTEVEYILDIGEWTVRAKLPEIPSPQKTIFEASYVVIKGQQLYVIKRDLIKIKVDKLNKNKKGVM